MIQKFEVTIEVPDDDVWYPMDVEEGIRHWDNMGDPTPLGEINVNDLTTRAAYLQADDNAAKARKEA